MCKPLQMTALWLLLNFFTFNFLSAQYLENGAFESIFGSSQGSPPPSWQACHQLSTPDTQPDIFSVNENASEGTHFMGMVTRGDLGPYANTVEDCATNLLEPLLKDQLYDGSIDLFLPDVVGHNISVPGEPSFLSYSQAVRLEIWGGTGGCKQEELLWTSPPVDHLNWQTYEFSFRPFFGDITSIKLKVQFDALPTYFGTMMIDDFQITEGSIESNCFNSVGYFSSEWTTVLGGSENDIAADMTTTVDGGWLLAGSTESDDADVSNNSGNKDIWLSKIDANGDLEWEQSYGGSGVDEALSVVNLPDNTTLIAGRSNSLELNNYYGNFDGWVIKIDAMGNVIWEQNYGGSAFDMIQSIVPTSDGNYVFAARSSSTDFDVSGVNGNEEDFWIVKIDDSGTILWEEVYGGIGLERPSKIMEVENGNLVIVGSATSIGGTVANNYGATDGWVLKLDMNGQFIWEQNYGGSLEDQFFTCLMTSTGNYVFAGRSESNDVDLTENIGNYDGFYVLVDPMGNLLSSKSIGRVGNDVIRDVEEWNDGELIFSGASLASFWWFTTDSGGNFIEESIVGGRATDVIVGMEVMSDSTFVFGGYSILFSPDFKGLIDFVIGEVKEINLSDETCEAFTLPLPIEDNLSFCSDTTIDVSVNNPFDICYNQNYFLATNTMDSTILKHNFDGVFNFYGLAPGTYNLYGLNFELSTLDTDTLTSINQLWENEDDICFALTSVTITLLSIDICPEPIIDSLVIQPSTLCGKDGVINSVFPDNNNLAVDYLIASRWTQQGAPKTQRGFFEFSQLDDVLNTMPPIDSAFVYLYPVDYSPGNTVVSWPRDYCNDFYLTRVTENWEEDQLTWNNQPTVSTGTTLTDRVVLPADDCDCGTGDNCKFYTTSKIDITEIANYWRNNPSEHHGLEFRLVTEEIYNRKVFVTSDFYDADRHPKLVLYFGEEVDIEIEDDCVEDPCEFVECEADAGFLTYSSDFNLCGEDFINVFGVNYNEDSCYLQTYFIAATNAEETIIQESLTGVFDISELPIGDYQIYALNYQATTLDLDTITNMSQLWTNASNSCLDLEGDPFSIDAPLEVILTQNNLTVCSSSVPILLDNYQISFNGIWVDLSGNFQSEFVPSIVGVYEYIYIAEIGACTASDTLVITVEESVEVNLIQNSLSVCSSSTPILLDSYQLSFNGVWTDTDGNFTTELIPSIVGVYEYIYTAGTGTCTSSDTLLITVEESVEVNLIQNSLSVCSSSTPILLDAYQISFNGVWTDSSGNIVSELIPSVVGVYEYIYTAGTGDCTVSDTLTITVNQSTETSLTTNTIEICSGSEPITLADYQNDDNGIWTDNNNTIQTIFNPANAGIYEFLYTVGSGECNDTDTLMINVIENNEAIITQNTINICTGETIILADYQVSENGAWTTSSGLNISSFSSTAGGNFEFIYGVGNEICNNTTTLEVIVQSINEVTLLQEEINICQHSNQLVLDDFQVSENGIWTDENGNIQTIFNPTTTGIFNFTCSTNGNCGDADLLVITVEELVEADLSVNSIAVCYDSTPIQLSDYELSNNGTWSNGTETIQSFIPDDIEGGIYELYYTQTNGICSDTDTLTISSNAIPNLPLLPQTQYVFCQEEDWLLTAQGENLNWYNNSELTGEPVQTTTFTAPTIGNYYVTQTINGCESSPASMAVNINEVPEQFFSQTEQTFCNFLNTEEPDMVDLNDFLLPQLTNLGEWSGTNVVEHFFTNNGLSPGTYPIAYTIPSTETCPAQTKHINMNVTDTLILTNEIICNYDHTAFQLDLEIDGGTAPYFIDNEVMQGRAYLSDWITGGKYDVRITDELGCEIKIRGKNVCDQIVVYPVPSQGLFNLLFNESFKSVENIKVEIFDVAGKHLGDVNYLYSENDNPTLDMRNLPAGVYLLNFIYGQEVTVIKVITI